MGKELIESLKKQTKEEVMNYLREKLRIPYISLMQLKVVRESDTDLSKEHYRFEMSGSLAGLLHNMSILNKFAHLGIYDYTDYLYLNFYKGNGTLYYKYLSTDENKEIDLSGYGTIEILYIIFELTIFSGFQEKNI